MRIQDVRDGTRVMLRDGSLAIVHDNYWNRLVRQAILFDGPCGAPVRHGLINTIDITHGSNVNELDIPSTMEVVDLTPSQLKRLRAQRHLEYVTSPQSETYWCS